MTTGKTTNALPATVSVFIPLSALVLSQDNVRKIEPPAAEIEQLSVLLATQGQLSALQVSVQLDADGVATGFHEVEAGGRRYRAFKLLEKKGSVWGDFPVECKVIEKARAVEVSLTENVGQAQMHAADEFAAYKRLVDEGKSEKEVAATFGVKVLHVQRRLKMANVAPKLVTLFREGKATLDQIMALASVDDQERQLLTWNSLGQHNRHPQTIKRRLTEDEISEKDPRVKLIGLKNYIEHGGEIRADLFSEQQTRFLTDLALVEFLVNELLESQAAEVRAEGWAWVEVHQSYGYEERKLHSRMPKTYRPETPEDETTRLALEKQYSDLDAANCAAQTNEDWDKAEKLDAEMEGIAAQLEALKEARLDTSAMDKSLAGAVVTLNEAEVVIVRGLVLAADLKKQAVAAKVAAGGEPEKSEQQVPEKLMLNLTSHRTAAIQAMMAKNQQVTLAALANTMALSLFNRNRHTSPVKISLTEPRHTLERNAPTLAGSRAAQEMDTLRQAWTERLPEDSTTWFAWFLEQPHEVVLDLIVFATANCAEAVQCRFGGVDHAQPVASALSLDMADWWEPKPETYLTLVPKAKLIEAVTESTNEQVAAEMLKMKKNEAIDHAFHHLAGRRWLPPALRSVEALAA